MQCTNCGKTGFVVISGKRFCSNCGTNAPAAASTAMNMSEITSASKTLDLRTPPAATAAAPNVQPLPAAQLHGRQVTGAALRDIRPMQAPQTAAAPQPIPAVITEPAAVPVAQPVAQVKPVFTPVAPALPAPTAGPSRLSTPIVTAPAPAPVPLPVPTSTSTPASAISTFRRSPYIQKLPPNPASAQAPESNPLPNVVKAQIEALAKTPPAPAPEAGSSEFRQALSAAKHSNTIPNVTKVAAAIAAIGIMSGLIWLQNAPKLAFNNAAAKAGIDASLPTYIPSSYQQNGPADTSSGRISINFTNASSETPLSIVQRRTNWDSNSLRENYVSRQTASFLAVQGQGLIIYVDDNQANWVNHGIWYQIVGTSKLGRQQVLKIAYGL